MLALFTVAFILRKLRKNRLSIYLSSGSGDDILKYGGLTIRIL